VSSSIALNVTAIESRPSLPDCANNVLEASNAKAQETIQKYLFIKTLLFLL